MLAGFAWWGFSALDRRLSAPAAGTITPKQYSAIRIGQAQQDVRHRLGPPTGQEAADDFPPAGPATTCDAYTEADTMMDPGAFRICYSGGVVTQKSSCGVFNTPMPDSTDAPACEAAAR